MADYISEALISRMAEWVLGIDGTLPTLRLCLFVNNIIITDCTNVISDFTQCSAPGYAGVDLVPGNWVGAITSCVEDDVYPTITYTLTGPGAPPQTIYGHYLIDTAAGDLWWSATWGTPFAIPGGGGQVKVNLNWSDMRCSA